jgi:SAM-dependent methyltransferase
MSGEMEQGHFAKKQIYCRSGLISWSHQSRFRRGVELSARFAGKKVLDYGAGDGTFLAFLMQSPHPPAMAVGAEIDSGQVEDCQRRLGNDTRLSFVLAPELDKPEHQGAYDALVCMEVLEHVVDVDTMLAGFARWVKPGGEILISVPVETGLPLLVKQTARNIAGWRGLGDYPGTSPYTWDQLFRSVFAGEQQHIQRPVHHRTDGFDVHDHKGFNWMWLRKRLSERFDLLETTASPIGWFSPRLGSQAWFLLRRRA